MPASLSKMRRQIEADGPPASPALEAAATPPAQARASAVRSPARALTSRAGDFWLLGGASIAMWAASSALDPLRGKSWAVAHHFNNLAALSASLALVVNYPHFMASYAIAYGRGWRSVLRHWPQLILVPAVLVAALGVACATYGEAAPRHWSTDQIPWLAHRLGLAASLDWPASGGRELLGLLINFMFLTVGWHYSKQTFGCIMVLAAYDAYPLSPRQRRVLKANLFSIWAASYTHANLGAGMRDYFGAPYFELGLPSWTYSLALAAFTASLVATVAAVVVDNWRASARLPSVNLLVPYVAFLVWWLPALVHPEFYLLAVPFFHSLQYLPFVQRVERTTLERTHPRSTEARLAVFWLALVVAGFLAFEVVPSCADAWAGSFPRTNAWLYFIAAQLLINVHHYFIDNTIWRLRDASVREALLA